MLQQLILNGRQLAVATKFAEQENQHGRVSLVGVLAGVFANSSTDQSVT